MRVRTKSKKLIIIILLISNKKVTQENLSINYYKTKNGKEVDFVLSKNGKVLELVQVCFSLNDQNYNREVTALFEASKELDCEKLTVYVFEVEKNINIALNNNEILVNDIKENSEYKIPDRKIN